MTQKHAFDNPFRAPYEWLVAIVSLGFGVICWMDHQFVGLDVQAGPIVASPFLSLAVLRGYQGYKLSRFRRQLLKLKSFSMSTEQVPCSPHLLYIGQGFRWQAVHRQRLHLLSLVNYQHVIQPNLPRRWVQKCVDASPNGWVATMSQWPLFPFKPMPNIGGKPWIHGVGSDQERPVYIHQSNRNAHECVFGMTRVGKTRYLSIKVNQDIRNSESVLVIDPKGDLEVMQDIYCAAKAAGRMDDLIISHFGFPDISAKYNPLASYSNVSEVATRVTSAISASGEGQTFKDFAWQYVNIVASCLHDMGEAINYKTIAFYIKRPEVLLTQYVDYIFPSFEPGYLKDIEVLINEHTSKVDKDGNPKPPIKRSEAIKKYLTDYIEQSASKGGSKSLMDSIIVPLYNAAMLDKSYYDKITASVGPVLDKINQTQAHEVFSWDNGFGLPEIQLENIIKRNQIVYIGLDSLTNQSMAEAVGQAIIADLVSLCGRLYSESSGEQASLCLHCDEFNNIVRDEFVNLLNKAGGAGVKVSAYTQTMNDLGAAFGDNGDKAKMLLGNFGTVAMLRVSNEDTASAFTRCLESIRARSSTPSTMTNDQAERQSNRNALFTSQNTDEVAEEATEIITINDLFALPKGQAFVMTNGGELYKVRMPLPKNDGMAPQSFESLLSEVNLCFE